MGAGAANASGLMLVEAEGSETLVKTCPGSAEGR